MASATLRSHVPHHGLVPPSPALPWRGRGLRYPASRWIAVPAVTGAAGIGVLSALRPLLAVVLAVLAVLVAAVWVRPALAACLLIFLTPLTAGIDRGSALPVLRPQEALAVVLGGTLAARGVVRLRTGRLPRIRMGPVEWALVLMAVAGSLLPLLRMAVRQEAIGQDDVLYALVLWKYLGLYVLIRASVSTDRHVRACLWLSVAASTVVAGLAILQSLGLFGVPHLLATYYAPFGYTDAFAARGSSTLGLPAATADLAVINLAIVAGLWTRFRRYRPVLAVAAAVLVMGALSAGEFSSALGLLAGVFCIAIVIQKPRLLWTVAPACPGGRVRPVAGDLAAAQWLRVGVRAAGELDGPAGEPAGLLLAQALLRRELPARRAARGPDSGRDPGNRLRMDRERLHLAAVGRRDPVAGRVRVPCLRRGPPGLARRPRRHGWPGRGGGVRRNERGRHRPVHRDRRDLRPDDVRSAPDLPGHRRRVLHPAGPRGATGGPRGTIGGSHGPTGSSHGPTGSSHRATDGPDGTTDGPRRAIGGHHGPTGRPPQRKPRHPPGGSRPTTNAARPGRHPA